MTEPRPYLPGETYLVTRRCTQRQFLLLPSEIVAQVFMYCLAVAAALSGVEVHGFAVLSNHYHLLVSDPEARLPVFLHWLNMHVSKLLNVKYRRGETLWSSAPPSVVRLEDAADVLDKLVYTITNPVSSLLVRRASRWPGLLSLPQDLLVRTYEAERPDFFFREEGPTPVKAALTLTKPPALRHLSDEDYRALVSEKVREREERIQKEAKDAGDRFLGLRKLRKQCTTDTPGSARPSRALNPRLACKDKWRRIEALRRLVGFGEAYRQAFRAWVQGIRSVCFPHGTYAMRVYHGASCAPP